MLHPAPIIAHNLIALAALLEGAAKTAREAADAATKAGGQNLAIGTALPLVETLNASSALLGAAIAIHRMPRL